MEQHHSTLQYTQSPVSKEGGAGRDRGGETVHTKPKSGKGNTTHFNCISIKLEKERNITHLSTFFFEDLRVSP